MFLPVPGAAVEGAGDQSSYKLLVEKHNKQRTLAAADRAALQQASVCSGGEQLHCNFEPLQAEKK